MFFFRTLRPTMVGALNNTNLAYLAADAEGSLQFESMGTMGW